MILDGTDFWVIVEASKRKSLIKIFRNLHKPVFRIFLGKSSPKVFCYLDSSVPAWDL